MPRFFIAGSNISGGVAFIGEKDYEHIRVLRIRKGEVFTLCDGEGTDYECRLADETGYQAVAEILSSAPSNSEPDVRCTVYAAWPKGDKAELIVQKCVELGAAKIVFYPAHRCVSKVDEAAAAKKMLRLTRIAEEAAKQSGRGVIPDVQSHSTFSAAVFEAAKADCPLFLYEDETALGLRGALQSRKDAKTYSVMTGPEGGFEPSEAQSARDAGMLSAVMGPRILRCETAPFAALSAVMYETGNLG